MTIDALAPTLLASAGPVVVFAVIAVGLVIGGAIAAARAKKRRQEALRAWAAAHGFDYEPDEVSTLEDRFEGFGCLTEGDNRYGYNVMRGRHEGRGTFAFDYHYETTSTDSKGNRRTTHHRFSAVVVDSGLRLEPLTIRTEGFFDRIGQAFGFDDIDFESAEFSRTFHVKSPDKRWAFDVIPQDTMEFLLAAPRFRLQLHGTHVMAWRASTFDALTFDAALGVVTGFLDRIPRDLAAARRA